MTFWIFRALVSPSLKSSPHLRKTPVLESISLVFFSTSSPPKTKPKITVFDYLVKHLQFSPQSASNVSLSSPKYIKKPQNADSVINFLEESGFAKNHIEHVVQRVPKILSANLEKSIKPKFNIFQSLGFDSAAVSEIISADPWILTRSADNRLGPSLLVLMNVLGSNAAVSRLLKISGWFLKHDLERVLMPNIEYLKSCGISSSQIVKYVFNFPRFFLNRTKTIKGFVERVDEMGLDRNCKRFLPAIRVVGSMTREKWELKLKLLRELGLSEENILFVFRRTPQALGVSDRKIKEVIQLLLSKEVTQLVLSVENVDISYIVSHPELLIYSVEKRLKPRLGVLKVLESKNLLKRNRNLATICKMSNAQFVQNYVFPYSDDLGDLCAASYGS